MNVIKTIGWIEIHRAKYGGVVYNDMAQKVLSQEYAVESVVREAQIFLGLRYFRIPESIIRLVFLRGVKDLWVRDFYSTLTLPFDSTKGKNLVMIHHDDFSGFPVLLRPAFALLQKALFYRALKKADVIVTVSEYWKQHFLKKGYARVEKIYSGFDFKQYSISQEEVEKFKTKYQLKDRPVVYLGNCQKAKGVVEAYQALQGLDIHLVTSGVRRVRIPARNLDLSHREYLCLLKASSVALAMSKFKEGWCITAHEAMLMKTPVIGSGKGGMRELLQGGGQMVVKDIRELRGEVEHLFKDSRKRAELGEMGYNFARQFSKERFERAWLDLIRNI